MDAFNARDLEAMLADLAADVDFRPLRLSGIAASYRGQDGVREWFAQLTELRHEHRIALHEARELAEGRVFAAGSLSLAGVSDLGPFWALYRFDGELIVAAAQYLTDPDMVEPLGLIR
ncbi:MAG TPA: nuclear transport factor 2 family protein [Solirubrobacteraceae bacterium]|nr:nuclear transport factor 2 family protein [Solirubrobacteraceae bacterium]